MTDALEVVARHVAAFNARDLDAVVETFADDAVFATGDELYVGRRGIRALFSDSFDAPLLAEMEVRRAVTEGDTAACELVERLTVEGRTTELVLAAFYTVRRGEIVRVKVYREGGEPTG